MTVVDILVDERVFEHTCGGKLNEQMSSHVIGQIGENDGTFSSLFDRTTGHFNEVDVSIDVGLSFLIVYYMSSRHYLAVTLVKVKNGS